MEEMDETKPFDLLDESVKILDDIKVAKKALKDVISNITDATSSQSGFIKAATKIVAKMGDGVTDKSKPLNVDKEAPYKDPISKLLKSLGETVLTLKEAGVLNKLQPYFEQLKTDYGISISIEDVSVEDLIDPSIEDLYNLSTSYLRTIRDYKDEIKEDHAPKAEEIQFVKSNDYNKVLALYNKGMSKGVDAIEDKCQDTLTSCEDTKKDLDSLETAVNLVHDHIEVSI